MLRNLSEHSSAFDKGNAAVAVVAAFGTLLRFYNLDGKQLWSDEIIQVLHSTPDSFIGILEAVTKDRGGAPLDYLIQHFVLDTFGVSDFTARLHAAVLGSLAIPLLFILARFIATREAALATALLFAVYPLHHHYSQEGRPYALFTFLTISSFLVFLYALRDNKWWIWACFSLLTAVSLYAAYYTIFVVFSQTVFTAYLFLNSNEESFIGSKLDLRILTRHVISMAVAGLLFVPWLYFGVDTIQGYEPSPETFDLRLAGRIIKEFSDGSYPLSLLFIVLGGLGVTRLVRERSYDRLAFLLFWGVMPLLPILFLLWTKDYFFAIRQVLFMTPALFILMGIGLAPPVRPWSEDRGIKRFIRPGLFAVVLAVSVVVIVLHLNDRRPDFRGAGEYISRNITEADAIIAPGGRVALEHYYPDLKGRITSLSSDCSHECLFGKGGAVYLVDSDNMTESEKTAVAAAFREAGVRTSEAIAVQSVRVSKLVKVR